MTKAVSPTRAPSWSPLVFVLLLPMLVSGVGVWEVLRGAANRPLKAVHFVALRPKGMKAAAFQDLLSRYANAAYARAALDGEAEEGAPAPGV